MKRKSIQVFAFIMAFILFISCPLSVYASEKWEGSLGLTLYYNKDKILQYFKDTGEFWLYGASQIGAIVKSDFVSFAENKKKMDDILSEGDKIGVYVDENDKAKGMFFSKEFMAELKALLEQYAKEHEPYYIGKTFAFDTADFTHMQSYRNIYNTINNILNESKSGFIVCSFSNDGSLCIADIDKNYADLSLIKARGNDRVVGFYENETWKHLYWKAYCCQFSSTDDAIRTMAEFKEKATTVYSGTNWDYGMTQDANILLPLDINTLSDSSFTKYSIPYLVSKETRRVRVFNTFADFQDYTLNKRSVYYTENYYNYVPEDLTVSIDDLEKAVDDLQKVIDELLKQIQDDTSEKEIEDLLRQILEEIRNGQGSGGGGGGSGGGDVTVDIDLSTTNGLLSKILAKVTQIFDKMSSTAGETMDDVVTAIEDLSKMLKKYLSEITGDLDDIKGQLENMSEQEFTEKTEDFLDDTMAEFSEIGEKAKTKFPFSIPNDIQLLISKMSASPPEDSGGDGGGGSGTYNVMTIDDSGSDLITVLDGDTEDTPIISETGAPVFYLPFVIESAGINEYVRVDLSGFDPISKFSRGLLTIWFILCLYNLTFKVMGLWGDLVD